MNATWLPFVLVAGALVAISIPAVLHWRDKDDHRGKL